ncbi:helix-turn-helix transcriptional regulator [Xanthobacter sp. VTT E-85241]|uniref:helix-turn-helix domain-containing protein n=1 Tax=Roseixanthobacter finlandensis TaxID=3119922 RepID=UPI00372BF4F9
MVDAQHVLGANVRRCRLAIGLSQEEVAERMGVDRAYVSGLESGRRNPTLTTIWAIAQALGVEMSTLVSVAGASEPAPPIRKRAPRRKPTG